MFYRLKKLFLQMCHGYWTYRAKLQFAIRRQNWPQGLSVRGPMGLTAIGDILIGEEVTIVNTSKYNRAGVNHSSQLVCAEGARLTIGSHVAMSGSSIYCTEKIDIGDNVLLGANASIYDTDFHPMDYMERRESASPASAPVVIEDDVWLCANVLVLKGVRIGARSVIAAGSVVTKDIPADTLAGGVPARPIGPTPSR